MLLVTMIYGAGRLSLDGLLAQPGEDRTAAVPDRTF
jgi:hypothetical protein